MQLDDGKGVSGARNFARMASVLAMLASLAGCSALSGGAEDPGQPKRDSFLGNLMQGGPSDAVKLPEPTPQTRFPDAVTQQDDFDCPVLDVSPNGAALRDFAGGAEAGAQGLRHQVSITRVARECKDAGKDISMKLGVEGSVLLGPSGSSGSFRVPLVFEARLKDKVVASRRETISVTIPPNEARAFYSTVIADFVVPKDDDVDVYVGLSQGGDTQLAPPKHRVRRKKR